MGTVKIDTHSKERSLESKYAALDNADGVRLLLSDYHALCERRYKGDTAASDILIDLAQALRISGLTDRQLQALALVYFEDWSQVDAAHAMQCSKQTVNRLVDIAAVKVARVYEYWARHGEGYSLTTREELM